MKKKYEGIEGERLTKVIEALGMTPHQFAKAAGFVNSQRLYFVTQGRNGVSNRMMLEIQKKFPTINPSYIKFGIEPMFLVETTAPHDRIKAIMAFYGLEPWGLIQKIGTDYAADVFEAYQNGRNPPDKIFKDIKKHFKDIPDRWLFEGIGVWPESIIPTFKGTLSNIPDLSKVDFVYTIPDAAMEPYILKGDQVGCRKLTRQAPYIGGREYHIKTNAGDLVRRLFPEGAKIRFDAINEKYPPVLIDLPRIEQIASITWILRFLE